MQEMTPSVKTSPPRKYHGAFDEFQNFVQDLQAEDLFALKHFLLKDSLYKRPVSIKTGPVSTKPSVVPDVDGLAGTSTLFSL